MSADGIDHRLDALEVLARRTTPKAGVAAEVVKLAERLAAAGLRLNEPGLD